MHIAYQEAQSSGLRPSHWIPKKFWHST